MSRYFLHYILPKRARADLITVGISLSGVDRPAVAGQKLGYSYKLVPFRLQNIDRIERGTGRCRMDIMTKDDRPITSLVDDPLGDDAADRQPGS